MDKIIEKQKRWKKFEEIAILPITKKCELCKKYGACWFHENWANKVKGAFEKL